MGRVILPFKEYEEKQVREALGPDNRWFAGEELGHSPTDHEAMIHYVESGGAKNFAEKFVVPNNATAEEKVTAKNA